MTTSISRPLKPWASPAQLAQRIADEQLCDLSPPLKPNCPAAVIRLAS